MKLRRRPATLRTSFIAQHLDRIGIGSLEGGIKRCKKAEQQGHEANSCDLDRISLGRKLGEETNGRIPQILTSKELDEFHNMLAEKEEGETNHYARTEIGRATCRERVCQSV